LAISNWSRALLLQDPEVAVFEGLVVDVQRLADVRVYPHAEMFLRIEREPTADDDVLRGEPTGASDLRASGAIALLLVRARYGAVRIGTNRKAN
jgi:hypothetical protein